MQRATDRPWFVPRRIGIGWRPASWQGWLVTAVTVGVVIGVFALLRRSPSRIPIAILVFAAYAIVALRTGGARGAATPPAEDAEAPERLPERTQPALRRARRRPLPSGPPVLSVESLTKRFEERLAVDGVSFEVAAGEVFGFLGPNGAGKSTTVRMLGTLLEPSSGSAVVAGIPLEPANDVEIRRRIAVMPENPGLYLRLTVAENLELFAGLYGVPEPQERIARVLDAVNLRARANDPCSSLSKGLRQRVGLARALLSEPAIVFLDEPTSGLDPVAARDVHGLIEGLRERGVTVFLTTHRLEEAEQLCDRVAILNTSLRTIGTPDELRERVFTRTLVVRTAEPLAAPQTTLAAAGVESWQPAGDGGYTLTVADPRTAAPAVTRALVAAGADVLSIGEERRSLEDVYLELVRDDVEAQRR